MRIKQSWLVPALLASVLALNLAGCRSGGNDNAVDNTTTSTDNSNFPDNAIFVSTEGNLGENISEAFIEANNGDTIVLPEGRFEIDRTLLFDGSTANARNVTITGYGMDETILDFENADSGDGIYVQNTNNITIQDLGVYEAKNNGIKLKDTNGIILRRVSTVWEGELNEDNGAYGLYPVECQNVLIEDSYVRGSADAGIYVGQSDYIVVRRNIAKENVAGIEIENSKYADVYDNEATGNTGGILVFDLPIGNQLYGNSVRVFNNRVISNNTENFATDGTFEGGVHIVPPGTGVIILSTGGVEVFNNIIEDHKTMAVAVSSYLIAEGPDLGAFVFKHGSTIADGWRFIPRNIYIHNNEISNTGYDPDGELIADIISTYMGPVGAPSFPAILYDGMGEFFANAGLTAEAGIGNAEPPFAEDGSDNICATNNGDISLGQIFLGDQQSPTPAFAYTPNPADPSLELMNCTQPSLPVHLVTYGSDIFGCGVDDDVTGCDGGNFKAGQGDIGIGDGGLDGNGNEALCDLDTSGVNWSALQEANCPNLSDYNLFSDNTNPKGETTDNSGLPYDLNTALFSDYSSKYRYVFVPNGETAEYQDQEVFTFPVGSVLVKTFAMPDNTSTPGNANEELLETRLLIRRAHGWDALPFAWNPTKDDATLAKAGRVINQSVVHDGEALTFEYTIPSINQCVQCHQYQDTEGVRFEPIGPKARHLNKDFMYTTGTSNQLSMWSNMGILSGVPADLASLPTIPKFGLLGNGDLKVASDEEIMNLGKGYLDINCAHCHRNEGNASNTGLNLEYWRSYEGNSTAHGACKTPVAYGTDAVSSYDVVPGDAEDSIMHYRMVSTDPGDRMPEIGRSLSHDAGVELIAEWINRLPEQVCDRPT
ncbi:parallel beta-helix domain-containing protein [Endozoicomonas ascidiicola]|uniref:parallel beta-helix domain-containing protein n=1 Tax=Endozoicomonas ascidiicola TaxID=1698521 RepID=UPI0008335F62|nr:parallel beta-helix domain-containing protein [Endozoicomonas ascidiicola]